MHIYRRSYRYFNKNLRSPTALDFARTTQPLRVRMLRPNQQHLLPAILPRVSGTCFWSEWMSVKYRFTVWERTRVRFYHWQDPGSHVAGVSAGASVREQKSPRDEGAQRRASPALRTRSAAWGPGTWRMEASRRASDQAFPSQGAPGFYLFLTSSRTEEHMTTTTTTATIIIMQRWPVLA